MTRKERSFLCAGMIVGAVLIFALFIIATHQNGPVSPSRDGMVLVRAHYVWSIESDNAVLKADNMFKDLRGLRELTKVVAVPVPESWYTTANSKTVTVEQAESAQAKIDQLLQIRAAETWNGVVEDD